VTTPHGRTTRRAAASVLAFAAFAACATFGDTEEPSEDAGADGQSEREAGSDGAPPADVVTDTADAGKGLRLVYRFADETDVPPGDEQVGDGLLELASNHEGAPSVSLATLAAGAGTAAARWRIPIGDARAVAVSVRLLVNEALAQAEDTLMIMLQCRRDEGGFSSVGFSTKDGSGQAAVNAVSGTSRTPIGDMPTTPGVWRTLGVTYRRTGEGAGPLEITLDGESRYKASVSLPCDVASGDRFELLIGPRTTLARVSDLLMAIDEIVVDLN
jgi:hypothetical protein